MSDQAGQYPLFRKRLDAFTRAGRRVPEGDIEALHRTRIASRRLLELLPVLGLDGETTRRVGRGLKNVTRHLGPIRDLDVLAGTLQQLELDPRCAGIALKPLSETVRAARLAAFDRLADGLRWTKVRRLVHRLEGAAKHLKSEDERSGGAGHSLSKRGWVWAVEARAAHHAVRLRSTIETAGAVYVPERLHDVRIALKKLRYAAELRLEARQMQATTDMAALKTAQDLLGRLHDLAVLIERVRQEQAAPSPTVLALARDLGSLVHLVEGDCRALHARYMRGRIRLAVIADRIGGVKSDEILVPAAFG